MNNLSKKIILGIFIATTLIAVRNYYLGYSNAISWEVTTTAEIMEFPALSIENGLLQHEINGSKYLLQERFSGSQIQRNLASDQIYLVTIWLGLCIFLALSTSFSRYFFFVVMAALALFINRLNLFEIGLFGIQSKWVMVIPFAALAVPLIYFHEFNKKVPLLPRLAVLVILSVAVGFGIDDSITFSNHLLAHSLFSFMLFALVFLLLVSEEVIFSLLFVVSSSKGGKSNHIHIAVLSIVYLGNVILYYLNKSGIYQNTFFFFDPFFLLIISTLVALWSIKFKNQLLKDLIPEGQIVMVLASLGIITFSWISIYFQRGIDSVYQSYYYFIVYFHIGFGAFFFIYILANFLDPLIKGFEVYKIVYRERNFPYVTARLGGLVVIAALYFLSGQEAYNLLRSGYYALLSEKEKDIGEKLLSDEYLSYAEYLGFNTHYPNYQLGWTEWNKGKEFSAKSHFFNASQRYPSAYAWINYGNIDSEFNPNKVQANYEEALRRMNSPEMKNNLGVIHLNKGEVEKALTYFNDNQSSNAWNDAPSVNKWNAIRKLDAIDSTAIKNDYQEGNFGVKANILSTLDSPESMAFVYEGLRAAVAFHRQAYLINSSYLFDHDSLPHLMKEELSTATDANTYGKLAKSLALHLYKKGEVNEAFVLLDELQGGANRLQKGEYLDILGKLALDQGAYQLSIDFFTQAIREGYESSRINRLESFASIGREETVTNELLKIIEKDPGLTAFANGLLEEIKLFQPQQRGVNRTNLDSLAPYEIIRLAKKNAFDEDFILRSVVKLNSMDTISGYDILVEAIEINPYSAPLLKSYILSALEWNLTDYAEQSLAPLQEITSAEEYAGFLILYAKKQEEVANEEW